MRRSRSRSPGRMLYGWWIVIYDRTESYTYALLPFVVAYDWPG